MNEIDECPSLASDHELLRTHVESQSDESFRALVARYADLVYSSALRQVGNHAAAQDITQAVFTVLARKAHSLTRETVLAGWLVRATRYTALDALKVEARRARRERTAAEWEQIMTERCETESGWEELGPHLDAALNELSTRERNAVVLRFFEKRSWREVGDTLGLNENAARVRVGRAVEKLRSYFRKRGVAVSSSTLSAALLSNCVQAAPAGLLAGWQSGNSLLATLLLRRLLWQKFVSAVIPVALVLLIGGLIAWRLTLAAEQTAQADAAARLAITNQQQAIAREARAVVVEIDRGLFFNDPQAFVDRFTFATRPRKAFVRCWRITRECQTSFARHWQPHRPRARRLREPTG